VVLSPHQFRHLAAERFLRDNPGHYEEVRRLLGHATIATTIRSYARSENRAAHERFDALVAQTRSSLRRRPKSRRRAPRARQGRLR
jgi:integrase